MSAPLVWIGAGAMGGLGALVRHLVGLAVDRRAGAALPWGTLTVNLAGALALGALAGAGAGADALMVAGGGLMGSLTTFSTWMFESRRLAEEGQDVAALANLAVALALGLAAAGAGWALGAAL